MAPHTLWVFLLHECLRTIAGPVALEHWLHLRITWRVYTNHQCLGPTPENLTHFIWGRVQASVVLTTPQVMLKYIWSQRPFCSQGHAASPNRKEMLPKLVRITCHRAKPILSPELILFMGHQKMDF